MKGSLAALVCCHLQVVLRVLADSRVLCGAREWPRVAESARTSLAWCRGYLAFAIERISLPPSRALRAFARNTRWGSEVLGCMDRSHAAALHRCRSDVGVNRAPRTPASRPLRACAAWSGTRSHPREVQ